MPTFRAARRAAFCRRRWITFPSISARWKKNACFIGSAAVIILSDQDDVKAAALNLMRFFEDESCGQCTPCRVGTQKAALLMERGEWNRELLDELSQAMREAWVWGLGQAASNPLTSVIKYFPEEFAPKEAAE